VRDVTKRISAVCEFADSPNWNTTIRKLDLPPSSEQGAHASSPFTSSSAVDQVFGILCFGQNTEPTWP
jgi:hypothetical protein